MTSVVSQYIERSALQISQVCLYSTLKWSKTDPFNLSAKNPAQPHNLVNGEWTLPAKTFTIPDPLNGEPFINVPDTQTSEISPFVNSLKQVSKSGMHNPLKNPERYNMYGDISSRCSESLRRTDVKEHFTKLIQRVSPKSYAQAMGEVNITLRFLENFCGDQVRFLARGFTVSGDHMGQQSFGYRWPYGPVALITPFNFPLEIPALQLMGALYMGNKPLLHSDHRVSIVAEEFVRLLIDSGMPSTDMDLMHGKGTTMGEILKQAQPRNTLFTGSQKVAEKISADMNGKVRLEDAGFDWKILGPDVSNMDYVVYQSDQDAFACSGQKCSAMSILFMHSNWKKAGFMEKVQKLAEQRKLEDLTIGPVLTWNNEQIKQHISDVLSIPGSQIIFGGKEIQQENKIPECYGSFQPTAVFIPLDQIMKSDKNFDLATKELFGPFYIVTEYDDGQIQLVLDACEKMSQHLTAAVVSNDIQFVQKVLGNTMNGTTYCGIRARTTGAPQNHWFGPAGDPRGAGIGTPEAIQLVWSCHREIIQDWGPVGDYPMEQT